MREAAEYDADAIVDVRFEVDGVKGVDIEGVALQRVTVTGLAVRFAQGGLTSAAAVPGSSPRSKGGRKIRLGYRPGLKRAIRRPDAAGAAPPPCGASASSRSGM